MVILAFNFKISLLSEIFKIKTCKCYPIEFLPQKILNGFIYELNEFKISNRIGYLSITLGLIVLQLKVT